MTGRLETDGGHPTNHIHGSDCPHCGHPESRTVDTRVDGLGATNTITIRECAGCAELWGEPRDFYGVVSGDTATMETDGGSHGQHGHTGTGEDTQVLCPATGTTYGPAGDTDPNWCPYCGEDVADDAHRVFLNGTAVACENTTQSTFRYCPGCGDGLPGYTTELETDADAGGLREKYTVLKDGDEQRGCFVLKPASDPAARTALAAYADATENTELETDLREWLDEIRGEPATDGGHGTFVASGSEPRTDGGQNTIHPDELDDVDAEERERYERAREIFTCPECGELADARVDAENTRQLFWKAWAEVHTITGDDGELSEVYIHFSEDDVDRGRELRDLLTADADGEESELDEPPREDPRPNAHDDRPDLDAYTRAKARQGGDPHHRARTDGGEPEREPVDGTGVAYLCTSCNQLFPNRDAWYEHANGPFADVDEAENAMMVLEPGDDIPEGATLGYGMCDYPEPVADGGTSGHSEAAREWEEQAHRNVEKWDLQSVDALTLAMGEEMGEFAGDVLAGHEQGDTDLMAEEGRDLIRRMKSLGEDIRDYLEMVSEDSDGEPRPPEDRPTYLTVGDRRPHQKLFQRRAREELDDLMALGFQTLWALEQPPEGERDE